MNNPRTVSRRKSSRDKAARLAAGVQTTQQPGLLLKKAEVLLAMRRPKEAAEVFDSVLEIDPVNVAARLGRGRAALALGDDPRALADARAAIGYRVFFPQAQLLAGVAAWRPGGIGSRSATRSASHSRPSWQSRSGPRRQRV